MLINLYKNGNDSVGLHADAEPEMGPVIASVSLGAERLFRLKGNDGAVVFSERLPHGSLLIMAGNTQKNFKHEVPKEPAIALPRINLTFRHITHRGGPPAGLTGNQRLPLFWYRRSAALITAETSNEKAFARSASIRKVGLLVPRSSWPM